jgi:hypothetical protein
MDDTTPEIKEKMREMMMSRTGSERVIMGASMFDAARLIVLSSLPKDLSEDEVKRKLFERIYGAQMDRFLANSE